MSVNMSGSEGVGLEVGVGSYQPGVYMPLKALFSSPARSAQSYCCHLGRARLCLRVRLRHTFG